MVVNDVNDRCLWDGYLCLQSKISNLDFQGSLKFVKLCNVKSDSEN